MIEGIHKASVAEVMGAAAFPALIEAYADEASIAGMPSPKVKFESYKAIAASGFLHIFAAVEGGELIGFITMLAPILPHYSIPVAVTESFYVTPKHRGFTGLRLLAAAEEEAHACGSPGLLVSAPFGSRLCELLPKLGYKPSNTVFFKRVGDE